jgi:hypothetical protein
MRTATSVSLGSSRRDKKLEITLLGQPICIERRGTDGDTRAATALFADLDGRVDALGMGGTDLFVQVEDRRYPLHAAHKLVAQVQRTPVVDGSGLKNSLERQVVPAMIAELGEPYASGRVLITSAADRFGMARSFFEHDYQVVCGDLMFALGLPLAIRSIGHLRLLARLLLPVLGRLPISLLYPTGFKQDEIQPRFGRWYDWATVIAGDCHYIKRHMPANLIGKIIVTNTTTAEDMALFARRGVAIVVTTTPLIDGRSFGTNLMEAALTAAAGLGRPLTDAEIRNSIDQMALQPTIHWLAGNNHSIRI